MVYLQVILGLLLLVFAGDFLVRGAVSFAKSLGVPTLIIGLTIIAFGTSAPELVVGIDAVVTGAPTLALGNVVGSNTANVLLVVGAPALIAPIACSAPRLGRNLIIMLSASLFFILLSFTGGFAFWQGLLLIGLLISFLTWSAVRAKSSPDGLDTLSDLEDFEEEDGKAPGRLLSGVMILGGLIGLILGAEMLVKGSVEIARSLHVSEAVIGLSLVALGTSLPELVTALVAAVRGHADVAVGSVIGSNLFNLLGIIGVSSLFGHIPVPDSFLQIDLWVMLGAALILVPYTYKRAHVGKVSGAVMVVLYGAYMYYLATSGAVPAAGV